MNCKSQFLMLLSLFWLLLFLNCAAFPDMVTSKERKLYSIPKEKVRFVFTGFYRYEQEQKQIQDTLLKSGFLQDQNSNLELEVILQKKDPVYRYLLIHRLNFVLTFLSGGLVPSHIRTEHTLTFRYTNLGVFVNESVYDIGMDQWRGIPVILLMITHWPNRIYKEQLIDATKLEIKEI
ncbi:hypothetical protein EHQ23_13615 [Leptospira bourretii]|uniref:Lipoprotein n=1 Tax=Leptospira bourretii TaxID=2484962 RepID=A0A4R9ITH9_9LEPT|nr:hypothetical protein [Leptospira bourretii]TGK85669.1 hypothetical protein EHQ23_13615 [Leptospira bourretii]TGK94565.1 hypothetical protein EHQ26_01045 [Leptospira bourretii]TGL37065.1 hypothetical protein EHQ45_06660 [Leptospira bourretii]